MTTLGAEMPALGEMPATLNEMAQRAAGQRPGRLAALLRGAATVGGTVVVIVLLVATIGPRLLPYRTFTVLSGSMEPTIPVGSMIFDREVQASDLARGDVVTFHPPGQPEKLVSHRIVRVEETKRGSFLVTRGDSNGVVDDWRIPAEGRGLRYEFHVPYIGYLVGGLLTPVGRLVALTLAALWLGGLALWTIWRPRQKPLPARG